MPRIAKKTAAKKAVKKSIIDKVNIGRVARGAKPIPKKAYTRKPKVVEQAAEVDPIADIPLDAATQGRILHSFMEDAVSRMTDPGQFSAAGLLDISIVSQITKARADVTHKIRALIDTVIECSTAGNATQGERDVLEAKQHLAVRHLELAMDGLERAIRG